MPTTRRRRIREMVEADGLTEAMYQYYAEGPWLGGEDYERATTEAERTATWKRLRRPILTRYLERLRERGSNFAGKRPRIYFDELEAEHPRRKVGTRAYWGPWTRTGPPTKETVVDVFENDFVYLARLNLLEEWEIKLGDPQHGEGKFD